jgi:ATP-dependent 26S proteasome regulatory subunit
MCISDPKLPQKFIGDGAPLVRDILMMTPPSVIIIHQIESFRPKRESGSKCDGKSVEQ